PGLRSSRRSRSELRHPRGAEALRVRLGRPKHLVDRTSVGTMIAIRPRSKGALGLAHPHVLERRLGDIFITGLTALIPAGLALTVTIALPHASLPIVLAVIAAAVGVVALVAYSRLEVTVTLVLLYLVLLDGPVKLLTSTREVTAAVPGVLSIAVRWG